MDRILRALLYVEMAIILVLLLILNGLYPDAWPVLFGLWLFTCAVAAWSDRDPRPLFVRRWRERRVWAAAWEHHRNLRRFDDALRQLIEAERRWLIDQIDQEDR